MATTTSHQVHGFARQDDVSDDRVVAFCSPRYPELFHAFAYANDIWKSDPFDVESIHQNARERFQRIVTRVCEPSGLSNGRILLLLGESGCGKTHLMRAFRNQIHSRSMGYCGYLQMSSYTEQYGRYVLNNLVDSLDKPYGNSTSTITSLMRISNLLADSNPVTPQEELNWLREGSLNQEDLDRLVGNIADRIILDDRFNSIDVYLVQALLYLQSNDSTTKARVIKYLRCEDLTFRDRRLLGGIIPCIYADAPQRVIQRLGELIWAVEQVPLIICVDQLEEVFDLDEAPLKFRRAIATLCDLVSRLPSAIVVIACLDDFYKELKKMLTRPIVDRVENDPSPIDLRPQCDRNDVERLIAQRLKFLFESLGLTFDADQPTYPLPSILIQKLVGLRARDVLSEVQVYRERCIEKGKMTDYPPKGEERNNLVAMPTIIPLEQAWNEFRSMITPLVPIEELELTSILTEAIQSCSDELETGEYFEVENDGRLTFVQRHTVDQSVQRILIGICNKRAQGGALLKQIEEVVEQAGGYTPVIVRSTDFPSNPQAIVSREINRLISDGGRCVVVQDSDWRTMMALAAFRQQHEMTSSFLVWLKQTRPLTTLASTQAIFALDNID
jgi:energy-coupling factor transporter ATP-binding protein EcfA2